MTLKEANGEKGIINVNYEADYTQTGDVRLTKISGGSAPNVVPASARAEITCPDDMKPQLMVLAAGCDRITCTETADGFEILANGSVPTELPRNSGSMRSAS